MGGKGSGGRRVGAGRKSKDSALALVHGSRDRGTRPAIGSGATHALATPVDPPAGLPDGERVIWDRLAPLAIARGTLTPTEADAFAELCETIVVAQDMLVTIRADGMMQNRLSTKMDADGGGEQVFESKAHPLIAKWTALKVRVAVEKQRFLLTGTGKERGTASAPQELSALEKLQAQAKQMRRVK
jgi:hypothetical protein